MQSVVDWIRENARVDGHPINESVCGIQPGGHPPPVAGQLYIAVDEDGVSVPGEPEQDHLKERLRISIFVSIRLGVFPVDRRANVYTGSIAALSKIDRAIVGALHGNQSVRSRANALLAPDEQTIQEPLWYAGRQKTRIETAAWSFQGGHDPAKVPGWNVRPLSFVGFRRVQSRTFIR